MSSSSKSADGNMASQKTSGFGFDFREAERYQNDRDYRQHIDDACKYFERLEQSASDLSEESEEKEEEDNLELDIELPQPEKQLGHADDEYSDIDPAGDDDDDDVDFNKSSVPRPGDGDDLIDSSADESEKQSDPAGGDGGGDDEDADADTNAGPRRRGGARARASGGTGTGTGTGRGAGSGQSNFVAAQPSVAMNSYVKLCREPPNVPVPNEQERQILLIRVRAIQRLVRVVAEKRQWYRNRNESHMLPIQATLGTDWLDDVPTDQLAEAGLLAGEVPRYSLDVLEKAAKYPTEPKGGVAPVLGHDNTDEETDEEVVDDDDGTLERFGSTRRGNYYIYQHIRTSIEEAGKNVIALWN